MLFQANKDVDSMFEELKLELNKCMCTTRLHMQLKLTTETSNVLSAIHFFFFFHFKREVKTSDRSWAKLFQTRRGLFIPISRKWLKETVFCIIGVFCFCFVFYVNIACDFRRGVTVRSFSIPGAFLFIYTQWQPIAFQRSGLHELCPFLPHMTRHLTGHKRWAGATDVNIISVDHPPPYSNRAHNNGQWAKMSLNMLSLSSLQHTVVSSSASNCPFMSRVLYSPAFSRTKIETRVYFQRGGPMKFQLKMRNVGPLKYTLVETMPVFRHPGKFVNMGPLGGRFDFTPHTSDFKVMIVKVTAPPLWSLKVGRQSLRMSTSQTSMTSKLKCTRCQLVTTQQQLRAALVLVQNCDLCPDCLQSSICAQRQGIEKEGGCPLVQWNFSKKRGMWVH